MLQLKNNSPFEAAIVVFPDEKAIDNIYIMVKATFSIDAALSVAPKQIPIFAVDEYWGEAGHSSLKWASEYHLMKPGTDIVMVGAACAPDQKPVQVMDVMLSVGRCRKTVRVFGERRWLTGVVGLSVSQAAPFVSMPLVYERAFGGVDGTAEEEQPVLFDPRNPVGVGFLGRRKPTALKGSALPNVEDPAQLIEKPGDCPEPAGFSYVAPSWEPRRRYTGTYDDQWSRRRIPYLPEDFDPRFFHTASRALICDTPLVGGEPVIINNMSPDGPLRFKLPRVSFDLNVRMDGDDQKPQLNLETLLLEPNERRMSMTWRASATCDKKVLKVEEIRIDLTKLIPN